ncbi:MAG: HAMP domain-containing histidine kinase [Planctomycetes bacterium]|nr:HAMP domain-containing histidine kinase [Planctomycetota bacterium]
MIDNSKLNENEHTENYLNRNIDKNIASLNNHSDLDMQNELIIQGSHAVKSPLTSLITGIQLMSCSKNEISPNLHEIVNSLEKSALGLKDLLLDIFESLKIINELNINTLEKVHFPAIVSSVKGSIRFKLDQQVQTCINPDAINIIHNQRILETTLKSLLENASMYSLEGSIINLDVSISENMLRIAVSDEGTGINKNDVSKICQPFYRSKMHKTNNFVGSGLGLTIVKNIVKKFNGDLQISSEQGKGSTFIVLLPITSD